LKVFTIGFTQKNAEKFFGLLRSANIATLIDVRLNNISQLAGFAKKDDLKFFLRELCGTEYLYAPELAPTKSMLNAYKNSEISWDVYAGRFLDLMEKRHIESQFKHELLDQGCLLCSEHEPHYCHRRLVVEYLNDRIKLELKVKHLF